jgi:hypothetical protein
MKILILGALLESSKAFCGFEIVKLYLPNKTSTQRSIACVYG